MSIMIDKSEYRNKPLFFPKLKSPENAKFNKHPAKFNTRSGSELTKFPDPYLFKFEKLSEKLGDLIIEAEVKLKNKTNKDVLQESNKVLPATQEGSERAALTRRDSLNKIRIRSELFGETKKWLSPRKIVSRRKVLFPVY